MSTTRTVAQLADDARLLAEHAARSGRLPPDSQVHAVLEEAARPQPTLADTERLIAALHRELNQLSLAVAPVTLRQLVRQHTWAFQLRQTVAHIVPFGVGLLTLMLTCYLAFQSSQLHRADTALREYQEWVAEMPREKLYHAWKMFKYERVLNVQSPPLAQLDAYQKLVEDARRLAEKGEAIQSLLTESSALVIVPPALERSGPAWWQRFANMLNNPTYAPIDEERLKALPDRAGSLWAGGPPNGELIFPPPSAGQPPGPGAAPTPKPSRRVVQSTPTLWDASRASGRSATTDCTKLAPEVRQPNGRMTPVSMRDVDAYNVSIDCFLRAANIPSQFASYSAWSTIYPIKWKINLLVVWLLPGLYGLLGACVYLMRDFVLTTSHAPGGRPPSLLSSLSIVLRIALGGLAGLIIGWFWVPSAAGAQTLPVVSSIPFGMAFLAGFSIETLFSLLDRLNRAMDVKGPKAAT